MIKYPSCVQDFAIVEADQSQVFIAASHRGGTVTLYLSDITGQFYVKSIDYVVAFVHGNNFLLDLYEVFIVSLADIPDIPRIYLVFLYSEYYPGRPSNRWINQVRRDNNNIPPADLWRRSIVRGHSGVMLRSLQTTR